MTRNAFITSPLGTINISATDEGITSVLFTDESGISDNHPHLRQAIAQLDEYFTNKRNTFDLPLAPEGTDFQKRVWNELLAIPFGKTTTYLTMAKRLGDEKVISCRRIC